MLCRHRINHHVYLCCRPGNPSHVKSALPQVNLTIFECSVLFVLPLQTVTTTSIPAPSSVPEASETAATAAPASKIPRKTRVLRLTPDATSVRNDWARKILPQDPLTGQSMIPQEHLWGEK